MKIVVVYVPGTHKEAMKAAMFSAGGGSLGTYTECSWETPGTGQFRAREGSTPHIGELHQLSYVTEFKIEMMVADECLEAVIAALKKTHPYETPAFHVFTNEYDA